MTRRAVAAGAFAAGLYPLAAFWIASPEFPRVGMLGLMAIGLAVGGACLIADALLRSGRPISRAVGVLAILWLALCVHVAGLASVIGFALAAAAATALGAWLVSRLPFGTPIERLAIAYLAGMALGLAALSLLLALPVHFAWAYAGGCAIVIAWQWRPLATLLGEVRAQGRGWRFGAWQSAGAMAVAAALVWAWGAATTLTPIAASDDLAYHLRLPVELLAQHRYSFDVARQAWAAAPWAADLAFAVPFVLSGGNEGVKVFVAGSYHLVGAVLLFGLLARRMAARSALVFLIAYLSIPLVMAVNHTLHTEGISAAVVLAVFALWGWGREDRTGASALAAAVLLGFLGAIKSSNLVLCLLLGLLWLPTFWARMRERPRIAPWLIAALATVLIPYATAWMRTGNPVLPLFNGIFRSGYFFDYSFANALYSGLFDWRLFEALFLNAERHLETQTQTAGGLAIFFLLLPALVLLAWRADRERRAAAVVALVYSLALLASQQYLRYLFPVMALAIFAVSRVWDEPSHLWKAWVACLIALAATLGVTRMTSAFWQTSWMDIRRSLSPQGRADYLRDFAPERALNRIVNDTMGVHATVLYLGDTFGADLHGRPVYPTWLSPHTIAAGDRVTNLERADAFLRSYGITHVITPNPAFAPSAPGALNRRYAEVVAASRGTVIATSGSVSLIRLSDDSIWPRVLHEVPALPRPIAGAESASGFAPARRGSLMLLTASGTCENHRTRVWLLVRWVHRGEVRTETTRYLPCDVELPHGRSTFSIREELKVPRGALRVEYAIGSMAGPPAVLGRAQLRGMGEPWP